MKIVIVIDLIDNRTNGSVMTAVRFADGLKKRGHDIRFVAIGAEGEQDCNVEERYIPLVTEVSARNEIKFGKFDKQRISRVFEGADLVHFIFPFKLEKKCKRLADEMGIPATAAFHVQPENISYNIHMGRFKPLNSFIYGFFRRFYKHFDRIHCPSSFIANQLSAHGYKGELYVISNGYDPRFVPPEAKRKNEKFEIVMTGRLAPEKNQQVLIKAVALSKHRGDIHLTLCGNGPRKNSLERLARERGVDMSVCFLPTEELILKLQQSDLYVHSASVEIEAIAAIEAIACGLVPIIADSPLSATPQFALDERSLFADDNEYALAQKINYWYEHEEERAVMGGIYASYAKNFSLESSLDKAEKMFADEVRDFKTRARRNEVRSLSEASAPKRTTQ